MPVYILTVHIYVYMFIERLRDQGREWRSKEKRERHGDEEKEGKRRVGIPFSWFCLKSTQSLTPKQCWKV